jgi:hypothetical protein
MYSAQHLEGSGLDGNMKRKGTQRTPPNTPEHPDLTADKYATRVTVLSICGEATHQWHWTSWS